MKEEVNQIQMLRTQRTMQKACKYLSADMFH